GFSSCSTCPGHRAVAPTPLEESASSASFRRTLLPSPRIRGLGLQNLGFRGHLCVHLRCGPVTHSPPQRWLRRWASEHRSPSALPSELRGFWLLPRRDCLPLNTSAFTGRTNSNPCLSRDDVSANTSGHLDHTLDP